MSYPPPQPRLWTLFQGHPALWVPYWAWGQPGFLSHLTLLVVCLLPMSKGAPVLLTLGIPASGPCVERDCLRGLNLTQTTGPQQSSGSMVLILCAWFPGVPVTTGQKLTDKIQVCPSCEVGQSACPYCGLPVTCLPHSLSILEH